MSETEDGRSAADSAGSGEAAPDLLESIREVGKTAREGLKEAGGTAKAFRALLAADVSLARSAFGRAMALTGVAIVFGASCWLLLMATLIVFLSRQLGLPWAVSLLICALLSGAVTLWAAWRADYYFDHTRMQATRRQLARLGIGELADSAPDPGSTESTRDTVDRDPRERNDDGNRITPP
ncbi:MAG: phage holin family protein [Pseudoxanthomonas sp.]